MSVPTCRYLDIAKITLDVNTFTSGSCVNTCPSGKPEFLRRCLPIQVDQLGNVANGVLGASGLTNFFNVSLL